MNDLPWLSSDRGQIALSLSALHRAAARTANVSMPRRALLATAFCGPGTRSAVRFAMCAGSSERSDEDLDHATRQITSKAVGSGEIVDIFASAGLMKPHISILSDEFVAEVEQMPQRNLAAELLEKLVTPKMCCRRGVSGAPERVVRPMLPTTLCDTGQSDGPNRSSE